MLVLFIAKKGVSNAMLASVFRYALKCDVISYEANDLGKKLMREKPQIIIVLQEVIWDKIYVQRVYSQLRDFFPIPPLSGSADYLLCAQKILLIHWTPETLNTFSPIILTGKFLQKLLMLSKISNKNSPRALPHNALVFCSIFDSM